MKMNKDDMRKMAEKDDAELWAEVQKIAASKGFNLGNITPKHEDIEKVRRALLGLERLSLSEATRIINAYKKGTR